MESLKLQVVAILMPLEIKHHKIPHLKALTCNIEHVSGQRHGITLIYQKFYLKSTHFTFYRSNQP